MQLFRITGKDGGAEIIVTVPDGLDPGLVTELLFRIDCLDLPFNGLPQTIGVIENVPDDFGLELFSWFRHKKRTERK